MGEPGQIARRASRTPAPGRNLITRTATGSRRGWRASPRGHTPVSRREPRRHGVGGRPGHPGGCMPAHEAGAVGRAPRPSGATSVTTSRLPAGRCPATSRTRPASSVGGEKRPLSRRAQRNAATHLRAHSAGQRAAHGHWIERSGGSRTAGSASLRAQARRHVMTDDAGLHAALARTGLRPGVGEQASEVSLDWAADDWVRGEPGHPVPRWNSDDPRHALNGCLSSGRDGRPP